MDDLPHPSAHTDEYHTLDGDHMTLVSLRTSQVDALLHMSLLKTSQSLDRETQVDGATVSQNTNQSVTPVIAGLDAASTVKQKRTPPKIEVLLRSYNREGITKWKDILDRLQNETPSIHIRRSTLGEYLKECNLGTSRRNTMEDSEMRHLVVEELNQCKGRKRGVRKIWETLKYNGHHVKRDFVLKVMKEVDPDGFIERRPKWKIPPELGNSVADSSLPVPTQLFATPSEHSVQNASSSLYMDTLEMVSEAPLDAQPFPISSRPSTMRAEPNELPFIFGSSFRDMDSSFSSSLSGLETHIKLGDGGRENDIQDWNMDSGTISSALWDGGRALETPSFPEVSRQASGEVSIASSFYPVFAKDVPQLEDWREDRDHYSRSDSNIVTRVASGSSSSFEAPGRSGVNVSYVSLPMPKLQDNSQHQISSGMTTGADNGSSMRFIPEIEKAEQRVEILRLQLKNTIEDILLRLNHWCAAPLEDPTSEPPPAFPCFTLATPDGTFDAAYGQNFRYIQRRQYVPDYKVPEEEVTNEALFMTLALRRTLSHASSYANILTVADRLGEIRNRLRDIGISRKIMNDIGLMHLKVIEIVSHTFGRKEWVLEQLWRCAAACVEEIQGFGDEVHMHQRKIVAKKAADAARQLISTSSVHSNFYRAISLHYDAITLFTERNYIPANDSLEQSAVLFAQALASNSSYEAVRETIRAMETSSFHSIIEDEKAALVLGQALAHPCITTSDPGLATLLIAILKNILGDREGRDDPVSIPLMENALSLSQHAVDTLRSFRSSRPCRVQPALVHALEIRAKSLRLNGRYLEAAKALAEAINIQQKLMKLGAIDDVQYLAALLDAHLDVHLILGQWKGVLDTLTSLVDLGRSTTGNEITHHLSNCLENIQAYLSSIGDSEECPVLCHLVSVVIGIVGLRSFSGYRSALVGVLLSISNLARRFGEFEAALDASREALAVARKARDTGGTEIEPYQIEVLARYAHSLIDSDAYEEATAHLQEAISVCKQHFSPNQLALFGVVLAHLPANIGVPPCIDEVITASQECCGSSSHPCWLSVPRWFDVGETDTLAWLLLIQAVMRCAGFPGHAATSAKKSLALMSQYYVDTHENLEPYARASLRGQQYILLCILGEQGEARTVLDESVALYRSVFGTNPHMARLPLLISLELLIILSQNLVALHFSTSNLQRWKKNVYNGSMLFFEEFVSFLQGLCR